MGTLPLLQSQFSINVQIKFTIFLTLLLKNPPVSIFLDVRYESPPKRELRVDDGWNGKCGTSPSQYQSHFAPSIV